MHSSCAHKFSAVSAKVALAFVTACLLFAPAAHLSGQTWVGTTTSWNTTGNWSTGILPTATTAVTFGNPTGGNYNLTFTGAGTTLGITFTNAGTSGYTINTSGQTLTIAGNGITNNNTFAQTFSGTGAVTVNATQTWNAASGDLTFTVSTLNINNVLTLSGANDISVGSATNLGNNLTYSGSGTDSFTGTVTLTGNRTVTNNGTGSLTFAGISGTNRNLIVTGSGSTTVTGAIATGSGTLTYSGTGTLLLSGTNTYTGATSISNGTLMLGNANALGTTAGSTTVASGALDLNGITLATNEALSITGTGVGANGALTNSSNTAATYGGTVTFSGNSTIGGTGDITLSSGLADGTRTLTKTGANNLTLNGAATGTGATIINGGTVTSGINGALGTGAVTINDTLGGTATLDLSGHNQTIGALTFGGATATSTSTNNLNIGAGGTLTLGGNVTYTATNNPFGSTISDGTLALGATRTFTINNSSNTAADLTVSSVISGTGFGLTKAGTGSLVLTNSNTYTGATTISAGALIVASNNALGTTAGSTTVSSGATLAFQGNTTYSTLEALSVTGTGAAGSNGAVDSVAGTNSFAGAITLAGNTTMGAAGGSQLTLSGVINDGASTFGLTKAGAGTLVLSSGANTYTGVTTINAGTLSMGSLGSGGAASNLGNSTNVATNLVLNGGTLQYTGAGESTTRLFSVGTSGGTIDASGSGAVNFTNAGSMGFNAQTGTRTLTLTGTNTNANTLAAIIGDNTGATSIAKTGTGEWVLSGANTYTGTTNITGGTLQIAGAANTTWLGSNTGGAVNISNGGTLDIGGVTVGNVVNFGAKQFNISGDGVGNDGAIINSSANQQVSAFQSIALTGDATIGGTGRFDIRGGAATLALGTNTLTKTGTNQVSVVGGTISGSGNIVVNQGEFAIQTSTNATGSGTFTFNTGTTLGLWSNTGSVTTAMVFNGANTIFNESGASVLGSNLTINGSTNFNIANGTSLALNGSLGGAGIATLDGTGTTGTLTLGANQVFNSELDLAGGTLGLAGYKLTVDTLHITGNSTIDFGNSLASILDTTNFIIDAGVTLTIAGWADATDYFYSTNNPGAAALSQITFNSPYASDPAKWLTYTDGPDNNHQITPVPESGTYGALLMAAALGFFAWQRRKTKVAPLAY